MNDVPGLHNLKTPNFIEDDACCLASGPASFSGSPMASAGVPPAVLPGTPTHFSIPAEKLIQLAQHVFKTNSGVENPGLLADDFRFEFPVVSLAKKVSEYCILKSWHSFTGP